MTLRNSLPDVYMFKTDLKLSAFASKLPVMLP